MKLSECTQLINAPGICGLAASVFKISDCKAFCVGKQRIFKYVINNKIKNAYDRNWIKANRNYFKQVKFAITRRHLPRQMPTQYMIVANRTTRVIFVGP